VKRANLDFYFYLTGTFLMLIIDDLSLVLHVKSIVVLMYS
jgi:hypothetical protein